jgi:perosamine synthetase
MAAAGPGVDRRPSARLGLTSLMTIPITRPYFGAEELRAIQLPLESEWVVQGPFVRSFEEKFSAFTAAPFSIATTSCTTALHLALRAAGLEPGDEVVVPAFTWISTANAVEYCGGRPVFCDIDLTTFNVDPAAASGAVSARTVGLLPVHLFGLCAEMDPVLEIAQRHGLWTIEDAACALGGRYHGRHAGTFGQSGCFSFHPRKSITTGEGGMITTSRADVDASVRRLRDHGASRSDLTRHQAAGSFLLAEYADLGYNYRMTDIQGALGVAQMARLEWILAERTRRARLYDEMLADVEWLRTPTVPEGHEHGYQAYVCLFRPETPDFHNVERLHARRNAVMARLESAGIATRQGTHAAALQRYYVDKYGLRKEDYPNAYFADRLSLALPLYAQMTDEEQAQVCTQLRNAIDG